MRRYISLLLFIGLAWGQDVYPYFSDMGKQLEFEQKKIVVSEFKESRQIIKGGGSEFNWLTLISKYEPTYKIAPITTEFEYVTKFSITKNSKVFSEIDFLNTIGLNEQADSLVMEYQKQILTLKDEYIKTFDWRRYEKDKFLINSICYVNAGFCLTGIGSALFIDGKLVVVYLGLGYLLWKSFSNREYLYRKSLYETKLPVVPQLQSFLSNSQVKALSEAYNRKLYNDISKQ